MKKSDDQSNQEIVYNIEEHYQVGQYIYHPVFKDKGKIIRKLAAPGDMNIIIVRFDRIGEKKLIIRGEEVVAQEEEKS